MSKRVVHKLQDYEKCQFSNCSNLFASHCIYSIMFLFRRAAIHLGTGYICQVIGVANPPPHVKKKLLENVTLLINSLLFIGIFLNLL